MDIRGAIESFLKKTLEVDRVELDDNFYDMGGNSLLAIQLITYIKNQFGYDVSNKELFEMSFSEIITLINAGASVS